MNTTQLHYPHSFLNAVAGECKLKLGISAAMVLLASGCATPRPSGVLQLGDLPTGASLVFDAGAIAITCPSAPASFSFDKARGRTRYGSEGAASAARSVLDPPDTHDAGLDWALGPISFAAAPFAAAYGAISAHHATLSAAKLSESKSDLAQTMAAMARQQNLRDFVLKAASEKTRRRLVSLESMDNSNLDRLQVSLVLETKLEELKLERTGSSDTSFALRIKARARLFRLSDGAVLYDRPSQYLSEPALFLDWTYPEAFRGVTETGYGELAAHIAEQVFSTYADDPVLLGAGYLKAPTHTPGPNALVENKASFPRRPSAQFVGFTEVGSGQVGIYSTSAVAHVTLQKPLTRDDAASEALSDVEWSLDGLENSRNSVVQLSACAAAIPFSLWKQAAAAVCGLSAKQYRVAEAQLSAAAQQTRLHEELAVQVAQQLAPRTSQQVVLVSKPSNPEIDQEPTLLRCMARGTMAWLPRGETSGSYLAAQGVDTALEIHVVSAALKGKSGINPPLAVCIDAKATLFRVRDGAELYTCPIHYRSENRKFVEWAAGDARLFREELKRCYQQMGNSLVEQLVARRVLAPGRTHQPTIANN